MGKIIGIAGFSSSGKDAAAATLVRRGYTRVAFGDTLKDIAYAINPYVELDEYEDAKVLQSGSVGDWSVAGDWYGEAGGEVFSRLQLVVDTFGWDHAKNANGDVRRLLQRLGTEAGRDILGENIWVDTAFKRAGDVNTVITDVRFENELSAIQQRGGVVWRVERPGVGPRNQHASETSLIDAEFDAVILNDGTLDDLAVKVLEQELAWKQ